MSMSSKDAILDMSLKDSLLHLQNQLDFLCKVGEISMEVITKLNLLPENERINKDDLTTCENCGHLIFKTDKYCGYCGQSTEIKNF